VTVDQFEACEICGTNDWSLAYSGPIRDGVFQKSRPDTAVGRCGGCGVERLAEAFCMQAAEYESWEYRAKLEQEQDVAAHHAAHDRFQKFALDVLWPQSLRGMAVADVGCAAGTFLDHLRGQVERYVGIEPAGYFHDHLRSIGVEVYNYANEAAAQIGGQIDLAFSLQVIEHTADPRGFLADIKPLLKPDGALLVSTPNRRDMLLELLPDDFPPFFYRVVHRWYFDADSLAACARLAGYAVEWVRPVQRYGLSNMMAWLRDRKPTGWQRLAGIDAVMDAVWQSSLEKSGRADNLFMLLKPLREKGGVQ
jgi:SAM-dependent methyltransferase